MDGEGDCGSGDINAASTSAVINLNMQSQRDIDPEGEIRRLRDKEQELTKQLEEVQVKAKQLASKESSLKCREKQLAEKKEFFKDQVKDLMDDLEKKSNEFNVLRRKHFDKITELHEKQEDIRMREAEKEELETKLEKAEDKLRQNEGATDKTDQRNEDKLVEQTKIAKYYRDKCRELESELDEAKSQFSTLAPETEELRQEKQDYEKELERLRAENSSLTKIKEKLQADKEVELNKIKAALRSSLAASIQRTEEKKESLRRQLVKEKESVTKLEAELKTKIEGAEQGMKRLKQLGSDYNVRRDDLNRQFDKFSKLDSLLNEASGKLHVVFTDLLMRNSNSLVRTTKEALITVIDIKNEFSAFEEKVRKLLKITDQLVPTEMRLREDFQIVLNENTQESEPVVDQQTNKRSSSGDILGDASEDENSSDWANEPSPRTLDEGESYNKRPRLHFTVAS